MAQTTRMQATSRNQVPKHKIITNAQIRNEDLPADSPFRSIWLSPALCCPIKYQIPHFKVYTLETTEVMIQRTIRQVTAKLAQEQVRRCRNHGIRRLPHQSIYSVT